MGILLVFKPPGSCVDAAGMADSWVMWLSVGVVGCFGILAMLNLLASTVRNEQVVFKLRCEVEQLQAEYARRMKEMRELEAAGLKVIEVSAAQAPSGASKSASHH
jgi:hypothetical protein